MPIDEEANLQPEENLESHNIKTIAARHTRHKSMLNSMMPSSKKFDEQT